ncbi:MAG: hypothetical protein OEV65_10230, partial [Aquincola sp.]|nr:hypothetical protein [Aquincola sp.]
MTLFTLIEPPSESARVALAGLHRTRVHQHFNWQENKSMNTRTQKLLRLSALSMAAALVFGCGGGGGDSASDLASASSNGIIQVAETASALSVSIATASDKSKAPVMLAQTRYNLSATFTDGPDKGATVTGLLLLKSKKEDNGSAEVEGRFMPSGVASTGTTSLTPEQRAQLDAWRAELKGKLDDLRSQFRTDVRALIEQLKMALGITDG